jgi:putative membrane protein
MTQDWMWGMHQGLWGVWGIGLMLMMLVFWGVVVAGIIVAIRWLAGQTHPLRSDRALDIVRERYARGEIGKDEFEAKKRDLG